MALPSDRAVAASPPSPSVSSLRASIPSAAEIGITGSQSGPTQAQKETLCSVLIGFREGGAVWQHNGDCIGVDEYAGTVWHMLGGKIHLHPPIITAKRAFLEAHAASLPKPYLDRNADIAAECGALVALPKEEREERRSGTWATVRRARKLLKPIMFIWPNGRWSIEQPPHPAATTATSNSPEVVASEARGDTHGR